MDRRQRRRRQCQNQSSRPPKTPLYEKNDIVYKTASGIDLHLDILYPVSEEPSPGGASYPVIVYTHGGGYGAGTRKMHGNMSKVLRSLIQRGFCVVNVQYRLVGSAKDGSGDIRIGDCVTDSKDAVRYLSKHHNKLCVDEERVFVFGDSAGGQIAQMILLSQPDVLAGAKELVDYRYNVVAGVSWYGPCDFERSKLFNGSNRFRRRILSNGMNPAERNKAIRAVSPINYLTKDSSPLLMVQGDKDTTIPVHHAHCMKEKADELGAPVELIIVRNAGHNFRRMDPEQKVPIEPSKIEIVRKTVDFFVGFLT